MQLQQGFDSHMTMASIAGIFSYRLCGVVDGVERNFHIEDQPLRVGRAQTSEIWLLVDGVSREHAILRATAAGLKIEDLGSQNGTYVDDRRVARAEVVEGAELGFGPVRLRVEKIEPADAELAMAFEPVSKSGPRELAPGVSDGAPQTDTDDKTREWSGARQSRASSRAPQLIFPRDYRPGVSPMTNAMYRQLCPLLKGRRPALIVGETGVGKEQIAKILHASSDHREGPFVAVNCAAIPGEMLEAEMFGIRKGVATGVSERQGKFQLAEGGTLFLDEIADMAPVLQAKLLRALQEREIQPVGGRPRGIDVRVVAATNADLTERMDTGMFRRDLFYRLAGHLVEVPALRKVQEDVPGLVEHFLEQFSSETGVYIRGVTTEALRLLTHYPWPGNVRELEHELHRLVCSAVDGQVIDSAMLAHRVRHPPWPECEVEPEELVGSLTLEPRLRQLETQLIREALRRTKGKRIAAAQLLGISRNGLAKKMKRLGLAV